MCNREVMLSCVQRHLIIIMPSSGNKKVETKQNTKASAQQLVINILFVKLPVAKTKRMEITLPLVSSHTHTHTNLQQNALIEFVHNNK